LPIAPLVLLRRGVRRAPMTSRELKFFRLSVAVLVLSRFSPALFAQGPVPDAPRPSIEAASTTFITPKTVAGEHRFWDKENRVLFAASAALSAADFAVTRANLQNGGRELNPVVRFFGTSTPALAANFAGETAGIIGLSYFFHRTGHHKLERVLTMLNIGSSAGAVSYDLVNRRGAR
jgi:hypothetical protein